MANLETDHPRRRNSLCYWGQHVQNIAAVYVLPRVPRAQHPYRGLRLRGAVNILECGLHHSGDLPMHPEKQVVGAVEGRHLHQSLPYPALHIDSQHPLRHRHSMSPYATCLAGSNAQDT